MSRLVRCFVAYPSAPISRAETIEHAIEGLANGRVVEIIGWKSLAVGGRVVIGTICEEIRSRDLFIADVTTLNPNVLFELGYAIAHRKRVWLILDPNIERAILDFERFQLLTTIDYCAYSNSHEITAEFYREQPYEHLDQVLYDELVASTALVPESGAFRGCRSSPEALFIAVPLYFQYSDTYFTFGEVSVGMRISPRNLRITCNHAGLTHFVSPGFHGRILQLLQDFPFRCQN